MSKTLPVSAINNGTVIDHVRSGEGVRIMQLLRLFDCDNKVTVGFNLSSQRMGLKDIIKIENRFLTNEEANEIVIFAPEATINIVRNFEVSQKITTHLPDKIAKAFQCPNPACITSAEPIESLFYIEAKDAHTKLICHYCEKKFEHAQVQGVVGR